MKLVLLAILLALAASAARAQDEDEGADGASVQAHEGAPSASRGFGHSTRGFANAARPMTRAGGAGGGAAGGAVGRQQSAPAVEESETGDERTTGDQEEGSAIGPSSADVPTPARLRKPVVRPGAPARAPAPTTSPGYAASPGNGGNNDSSSPGPAVKGYHWTSYPRLSAMPAHVGAHGIAGFRTPSDGVAVGFFSGPVGANGRCATVGSPAAGPDYGCTTHNWISASPGGAPLANCGPIPGNPDVGGGDVEFIAVDPKKPDPRTKGACGLQPNKTYYCQVTMTGFNNKWHECDILVSSPLGIPFPDEIR